MMDSRVGQIQTVAIFRRQFGVAVPGEVVGQDL